VLCPSSATLLLQVRVNFLSQLLPEGRAHLQSHLTASVLGVKVFELPFHRGVQVTADTAAAMRAALAYCQKVGEHVCLKRSGFGLEGQTGAATAFSRPRHNMPAASRLPTWSQFNQHSIRASVSYTDLVSHLVTGVPIVCGSDKCDVDNAQCTQPPLEAQFKLFNIRQSS
jgi:hypothetical protein